MNSEDLKKLEILKELTLGKNPEEVIKLLNSFKTPFGESYFLVKSIKEYKNENKYDKYVEEVMKEFSEYSIVIEERNPACFMGGLMSTTLFVLDFNNLIGKVCMRHDNEGGSTHTSEKGMIKL